MAPEDLFSNKARSMKLSKLAQIFDLPGGVAKAALLKAGVPFERAGGGATGSIVIRAQHMAGAAAALSGAADRRATRPLLIEFVYFVRCGRFVKIGRANNIERRINEIQTHSPATVEFIAAFRGGATEEFSLHSRFNHLAERGEWFREDADLALLTKELAACPTSAAAKVALVDWLETNDAPSPEQSPGNETAI